MNNIIKICKCLVCGIAVITAASTLAVDTPSGFMIRPMDWSAASCNLNCAATLQWNACADTVRVYRSLGAVREKVAELPAGTTEWTDNGAIVGVNYAYELVAVNGNAESAPTAALTWRRLKNLSPSGNWSMSKGTGVGKGGSGLARLNDGELGADYWTVQSDWGSVFTLTFDRPAVVETVRLVRSTFQNNFAKNWYADASATDTTRNVCQRENLTSYTGIWEAESVHANYANVALDALYFRFTGASAGAVYMGAEEIEVYGYSPEEVVAATMTAVSVAADGTLTWTADPSKAKVYIYRSRMRGGEYRLIAEVDAASGSWTDNTTVEGVQYFYKAAYIDGLNTQPGIFGAVAAAETVKPYEIVKLTENGTPIAQKRYGYAVGNWDFSDPAYFRPEAAFDGSDVATSKTSGWRQSAGGIWCFVGYNFNAPVKITKVRYEASVWSGYSTTAGVKLMVSTEPAERDEEIGYDWVYKRPGATSVQVGAPIAEAMADRTWWELDNLTTDWITCAYLMSEYAWYGQAYEIEFYGYQETAPANAVMAVEKKDITAQMTDTTLTLNWTLANNLATSIEVLRRVNHGEWASLATLAGDATTFTDAAVEIGKLNEYRLVVRDAKDTVWGEDFAIRPLHTKGERTVIGQDANSAWDYVSLEKAGRFGATFRIPATAEEAGVSSIATSAINLEIRKDMASNPAVVLQRRWDAGNFSTVYAYDPTIAEVTGAKRMDETATEFVIERVGRGVYEFYAVENGNRIKMADYTFNGGDGLDDGCLVGVRVVYQNLMNNVQQVNCQMTNFLRPGMVIIVR